MADTEEIGTDKRVLGTQALHRAFEIVRLVARFQKHGADLRTIAKQAELSVSTTFRMLKCLTEERMITYDEQKRSYSIGPLAYELGIAAPARVRFTDRWLPVINRVSLATRHTTYLMIRSDLEAVCLAQVQGSTPIRAVPLEVGERLPLGMGAGSLAILASLDDAEVERVIAANFVKSADPTTSHGELRKRLELTRANGFAYSLGTVVPGISGIGVAITPDATGVSLAISLSTAGHAPSTQEQRDLANLVKSEILAVA